MPTIHITSGDGVGGSLQQANLPGEVFVCHDVLYDGPRQSGWPGDDILQARATFLEAMTGGGLHHDYILETLHNQYQKLKDIPDNQHVVLWFDACLFDQSMLAHILMCLDHVDVRDVELLCIDHYPGIDPYHGVGQLTPAQLVSSYNQREPVSNAQFRFAREVDQAFAVQDDLAFRALASMLDAPLRWVPAAVMRWLQEIPDADTGLGRLEQLTLEAIQAGCHTPGKIFDFVSQADTPPQYWGDITLWAKINHLADREAPLVTINGPVKRLPQWEDGVDLNTFFIELV